MKTTLKVLCTVLACLFLLLTSCQTQEGAQNPMSPSVENPANTNSESSGLHVEADGRSGTVQNDGTVIFCAWDDGENETIHELADPDDMPPASILAAQIENMESTAIIISDINGVSGGGLIYIYRYDPTHQEWQCVPYGYEGMNSFFGFARFDADGNLFLAERFPIDLGGWGLNVYSLAYDAEQNFVRLNGPTVYNDTSIL